MRIFNDTKVYIIAPGNTHTGGPELLHQLCSQLIKLGVDAYMFYISGKPDNPIHEFYAKYRLPYVFNIEDNPHDVIIIPETSSEYIFKYKRVQKVFWWLSVNNYINNIAEKFYNHINNPLIKPMPEIFYFGNMDKDIDHWVQSEYARQFITLNGIPDKNIYMVEDYLNPTFLTRANNINLSNKEDIVAFNPAKGFEVTRRLIEIAPDIKWAPIQSMTPEQVQELLAKAKVYIDFGNHPGKDRIPREAAISGCVVITGKRGSAANNIDINIPDEFKFNDNGNLNLVINKIRDAFDNFDINYAKQADYRIRILDDKNRFENEVATAININDKLNNVVAIAQGLNRNGIFLTEILHQNNSGFNPKFIIDDRFCYGKEFPANENIKTFHNNNYFYSQNGGGAV